MDAVFNLWKVGLGISKKVYDFFYPGSNTTVDGDTIGSMVTIPDISAETKSDVDIGDVGMSALDPMKMGKAFLKPTGEVGAELEYIFQSAYQLFLVLSIIGIVFSIIYAGFQIILGKGRTKEEIFTALATKFIVFWCILGITYLVGIFGIIVFSFL